jgi:hypothetical protein
MTRRDTISLSQESRSTSNSIDEELAEPPTTESTDDSTVFETLSVSTDEKQAA